MVILLLACGSGTSSPDDSARGLGETAEHDDTGPDTGDTADAGDTADSVVDPSLVDADGDGYTPDAGDCDDTRPNVYPGAPDYCDGLDADCDGEPIPNGSCSTMGEASAMWSWWIQSGEGSLHPDLVRIGEVSGDAIPDLVPQGFLDDKSDSLNAVDTLSLAMRTPISTWAPPSWTSAYPSFVGSIPLPIADGTGDGIGDLWLTTDSLGGFQGGVFLFPGRTGGFPADPLRYDEGAQAWWLDGGGLELDEFIDGSVGDVTGDGRADVLVRTVDGTHDHLTLVPGDPDVSGEHSLTDSPSMWADEEQTDIQRARLVGDLDGDGCAEVVMSAHATGLDSLVYYLSGSDWAGEAHVEDFAAPLSAGMADDGRLAGTPDAASAPGDINGDGLDDDLLGSTDSAGAHCALVLSGGIPSGDVDGWVTVQVCGHDSAPHAWVADVDGDGSRDFVTWTGRVVPSRPLASGGTIDIADLRTPRYDALNGLQDITDLDGDGLPEWIFADPYHEGETYILAGFAIPWDDASKW